MLCATCRFHEYAAAHSAAELVPEQERTSIAHRLAQHLKEEKASQEAAAAQAAVAAQAAQAAAEQSAATAAQAAANTDTAQAMDTTAAGDDAFDAVAQETVAAAGHMVADINAPAAATTADSSAVDDAPAAEAGPEAVNDILTVLALPTPDDIAASVMAGISGTAAGADTPTAAALSSIPPPIDTPFPASAPSPGGALAEPQALPTMAAVSQLAVPAGDTDMSQASTIPQSDGPGDDPMEDAPVAPAVVTDSTATATPMDLLAVSGDTTAASGDTTAASVTMAEMPTTSQTPVVPSSDLTGQPAAPATEAGPGDVGSAAPEAPAPLIPVEAEVTDEQIKAAWLNSVDEVFTLTKEERSRRKPYEDAIKRPYFHVKPLDLAQLQNWSR